MGIDSRAGVDEFLVRTDVIRMVVGIQDGDKLQSFVPQIVQDGRGIARIDHGGMAVVANHPYVVVGKCTNRNDARECHDNKLLAGRLSQ